MLTKTECELRIHKDDLLSIQQLNKLKKFRDNSCDKFIVLGKTSNKTKTFSYAHKTYAVRIEEGVLLFRVPYNDKGMRWVKSGRRSWNK